MVPRTAAGVKANAIRDRKAYDDSGSQRFMGDESYARAELERVIAELRRLAREGPSARLTASGDGQGPVEGLVRAINHILDERQAAVELLETHRAQLLQSEKMSALGTLTAGIAHEINNPMAFIRSNLVTLKRYAVSIQSVLMELREIEEGGRARAEASATELLARIEKTRRETKVDEVVDDIGALLEESLEGAERVVKIVAGLRDFAHSDSSEMKWVDMREVVDGALSIVWNELKYKAEIRKDYRDVPRVRCAPRQISQVFVNLLVNAAQAIPEKGTVDLRVYRCDGTSVCVEVHDSGVGIPEAHMKRLFEPFYTTKSVGKGTGLGLHLSYRTVEDHGGRIEVESKMGKGSLFRVILPAE